MGRKKKTNTSISYIFVHVEDRRKRGECPTFVICIYSYVLYRNCIPSCFYLEWINFISLRSKSLSSEIKILSVEQTTLEAQFLLLWIHLTVLRLTWMQRFLTVVFSHFRKWRDTHSGDHWLIYEQTAQYYFSKSPRQWELHSYSSRSCEQARSLGNGECSWTWYLHASMDFIRTTKTLGLHWVHEVET